MAIFVKHIACPSCGSRDNRAVYSDGGEWCFGCGTSTPSQISGFVKELEDDETPTWSLPDDLSTNFPKEVINYGANYSIRLEQLLTGNYFWAASNQTLYRLFDTRAANYDVLSGRVKNFSAAEGRSFSRRNRRSPKYRFYGSKEIYPIAGAEPTTGLVLTEDSFSSIRVGEVCNAMPLFGTSISPTKLTHVAKDYQHIVVWLDHDKFKEGWDIAERFKWLGKTTQVILTSKDPKCYTETEIKEFLDGKREK